MAVQQNGNQLNLGKVVAGGIAAYTAHKALKARQHQAAANLKLKQDQLNNRKDEFKKRQEQRDAFHKDEMTHKATVLKEKKDQFKQNMEHKQDVLKESTIARKTKNKLAGANYEERKKHNTVSENLKRYTLNEYARDIDNKRNMTNAYVNQAHERTYQSQYGRPSNNVYNWNTTTRPGSKAPNGGNARDMYYGKGKTLFGGKKGSKDTYHTNDDFKNPGGAI